MTTHSTIYSLATFLAATMMGVVGCGSHVLLGYEMGGASNVDSATGGATIGSSDFSTGGSTAMPAPSDGGNCDATCSTPAGTVYDFTSVSDVYSALVGTWQICPGAGTTFGNAPADAIGIEFGPISSQIKVLNSPEGGNFYFLVQGSNGPVRGEGVDYQMVYYVAQEGSLAYFTLIMSKESLGGFGGAFRYSPCPREFQIDGGSTNPGSSAILVPF